MLILIKSNFLNLDKLFERPNTNFPNNPRLVTKLTEKDLVECLKSEWVNLFLKKLIVGIDGRLYFEFYYILCNDFVYINPCGVDNIVTTNLIDQTSYLEFIGGDWKLKTTKNDFGDNQKMYLAYENRRLTIISTMIKRYHINLVNAYCLLHKLKGN